MPTAPKKPKGRNELLAFWLGRAGFSYHTLARKVIAKAEESGEFNIRPNAAGVRWWVEERGQPRHPTNLLVAQVFTEHLGFPVTPADLGFCPPRTSVLRSLDFPWRPDRTVEATAEWTRVDVVVSRRVVLGDFSGVAVGAVLINPLQAWISATPEPIGAQARDGGRLIGMQQVTRIEQTTEVYRGWDNRFGGGQHRKHVVAHLMEANDLLANATYSAPVGRRLRLAVADLCALAAWTSFDSGEHQAAQRYWILGIHHAHDAGDRELAAYLLYEMARQMIHLDRPSDALELIQMAQYGTRREAQPYLRALLGLNEGWAWARLGCRQEAWTAVGQGEDALAVPASDPIPHRLNFVDQSEVANIRGVVLGSLAAHQDGAHRRRDLLASAAATEVGTAGLGEEYGRQRARNLMSLVDTYELAGEYDQASRTAEQLADAIGPLSSIRTVEGIRKLRRRLDAEPKDPRVRALTDQLDRCLVGAPSSLV